MVTQDSNVPNTGHEGASSANPSTPADSTQPSGVRRTASSGNNPIEEGSLPLASAVRASHGLGEAPPVLSSSAAVPHSSEPGPAEGLQPAMNLPPSPGSNRALRGATSAIVDPALTAEQLLAILDRVKAEIIADIRREQRELETSLTDKVNLLCTVIDKIHSTVIQTAIDARTRNVAGPTKKRKTPDPPSVMDHLDILLNPEQGLKEHLVFLQLLTVMSFSLRHTHFRGWLGQDTFRIMSRHREVITGCSGFSINFFGCRKDFGTQKFKTRVAAGWSLALRWVLAQKVELTRKFLKEEALRLGGNPESQVPAWLTSFGDASTTFGAVENVVSVEENTDRPFLNPAVGSTTSRASSGSVELALKRTKDSIREEKRRKMQLTGNHDPLLELRVHGILSMRTTFMNKMTSGRNEARKILYKDLFFLVEEIAKYESPERAREHGFEIVFNPSGAPSSLHADALTPSTWKIPLAKLPTAGVTAGASAEEAARLKASAEEYNMSKFSNLGKDFPFLTAVLKWRRKVHNNPPGDDTFYYLEESHELNLHKVIADVLHAFYKLPEFDDLLSSSVLSLRCIHVQALGLYALLRKLCGFTLCPVETSALGHVTWKSLVTPAANNTTGSGLRSTVSISASDILESQVTAMYGGGTNVEAENEERDTLLVKYRAKKLSISWAEYEKEKEIQAMESQRMGTMSTQSTFPVADPLAMSVEWMDTDLAATAGAE